jgi:hypothetical protein
MRCGVDTLEDCVTAHLAPFYGLQRGGGALMQWSQGRCPVCARSRCLTLVIKGGRIELNCHRQPKCDQDSLRSTVAARFPRCIAMRRPKRLPDIRAEAEAIVLDGSLSAATLRLRILMLTSGLSAREAADKLGYSRSTYYAAAGNLGRGNR